jgi:glutamine amidotransferase
LSGTPVVGVVDYGAGNFASVVNALRHVGAEVEPVRTAAQLAGQRRVVLPGVGAFGACMRRLEQAGLIEPLREFLAERQRAFLGICVGMQLLAAVGREFGDHAGLGAIDGEVRRIEPGELRLPHIGWNEVEHDGDELFDGLGERQSFYFVHSYQLVPEEREAVIATCEYGEPVTAAVRVGRAWGVQFHPEKSQRAGLALLSNFTRL